VVLAGETEGDWAQRNQSDRPGQHDFIAFQDPREFRLLLGMALNQSFAVCPTEPIAVGYHAVLFARLAADDVPLVIGCGPVLSAADLMIRKVYPIIAADFSPGQCALALRMRADMVIDPGRPRRNDLQIAQRLRDRGSRSAKSIGLVTTSKAPRAKMRWMRSASCLAAVSSSSI
jgi:hypothetical protein